MVGVVLNVGEVYVGYSIRQKPLIKDAENKTPVDCSGDNHFKRKEKINLTTIMIEEGFQIDCGDPSRDSHLKTNKPIPKNIHYAGPIGPVTKAVLGDEIIGEEY